MISKNKLKFIKSLQIKKYRQQEQSFLVEGAKSVLEVLRSDFEIISLLGTERFISNNSAELLTRSYELIEVSEGELVAASTFESNRDALAVVKMKAPQLPVISNDEFVLALDEIRDPGNLGTIIRIADWYGIKKIIASLGTAEFYNPKVISASMGSFTRVEVCYTELIGFFDTTSHKVYGAFMDGEDVHHVNFGKGGIILIGNEAQGISASLQAQVDYKITIPRYGKAESLNAAVATAVICDNLRKN
ncbi:MAG TPA: RNA methyltransferase [Cyclobacteriaceae bacterium]|nr:RNA methyltransferase [Cyclobacteriaceae bacterium]